MKKNDNILKKINFLFKIALLLRNKDIHIRIIRRMILIANKFLVKIPTKLKRLICYKCYQIKIITHNTHSKIKKIGGEYYLYVICKCGNEKRYKLNKGKNNCIC